MKSYRFLFLSVLLTGILFLLGIPVFAAEQTVYVSPNGDDTEAGTLEKPLATLPAAFKALPYGGKVVLTGGILDLPATDLPAADGLITITSDGESGFRMKGIIHFRSAVRLENLKIVSDGIATNLVFICHGNYACFGEGLTVTPTADGVYPGIAGGSTGTVSPDRSYVEICSGTWARVRGGARGNSPAPQNGDSMVVIRGGTFTGILDAGGDSAVNGSAYLFLFGGNFQSTVNGASASAIGGDLHISVYGGDFQRGINLSRGGEISGDVTVTATDTLAGVVKPGTGTVLGETVSLSASEETRTADEAFIAAYTAEMLPQIEAQERDFTPTGTVGSAVFGVDENCGDLDGNGKLNLADVLRAQKEEVDIDGDGKADVLDVLTLLRGVVNGRETLVHLLNKNRISDTLTLGGNAALTEDGIRDGIVYGSASGAYTLESDAELSENAAAAVYFGCDGFGESMNGYCFEISRKTATAAVYRIVDGSYRTVGKRTLPALGETAHLKLEYGFGADENGVALYCADDPNAAQPYPVFDLKLSPCGDGVGVWVSGGTVSSPICSAAPEVPEKAYTNYLLKEFTDVEIWFENGRYYLFGTQTATQNKGVQCYSTDDFNTFKDEGFALKREDVYGDGVFKAANILKVGDKYYIFYMTKSEEAGISRTAYAVADKVNGPYTEGSHGWMTDSYGETFIGGQPFVDTDGKMYLIYTRVGGGNRLYGAEMEITESGITLSDAVLLLEPTEPWENAKAPVVECGFIVKHNGLYYMLYSGGNYDSTYGTGYAVADSPLGSYEKCAHNPIMTSNDQAYGVGAATVFPSPDGSEHFIAYIHNYSPTATRPLVSCIDRIRFAEDPNGGDDYIEIAAPTVNPQALPSGFGSVTDFPGDYQSARFVW